MQEVWEPDRRVRAGAARSAAEALGYRLSTKRRSLGEQRHAANREITAHRDGEIDGWWGLALLSRACR